MRLSAAILTLGAGIAAAWWTAGYQAHHRICLSEATDAVQKCTGAFQLFRTYTTRPGWIIPLAILIGFAGLSLAALIYRPPRRHASTSLTSTN